MRPSHQQQHKSKIVLRSTQHDIAMYLFLARGFSGSGVYVYISSQSGVPCFCRVHAVINRITPRNHSTDERHGCARRIARGRGEAAVVRVCYPVERLGIGLLGVLSPWALADPVASRPQAVNSRLPCQMLCALPSLPELPLRSALRGDGRAKLRPVRDMNYPWALVAFGSRSSLSI